MPCPIGRDVDRAASILLGGGLVAFPTETVYGLGANALDARAVAGIFAAKNRPSFDPLIVHIASIDALDSLASQVPVVARRLADRFWPGPLTLVLPKTPIVPDLVTSGLHTVAVRIPNHPVAQELLTRTCVPVAAPSANTFGCLSPTCADHVLEQLGSEIDYILDGGPSSVGLESTVLSLVDDRRPIVLRLGGLSVEAIEAAIGRVEIAKPNDDNESAARQSPGMLTRHYAPRTRLVLREAGQPTTGARRGMLAFQAAPTGGGHAAAEILSPSGDLNEAAANFFAALRRLDALGLDEIEVERFPDEGLGRALNDRLRRAAAKD